MDIHTSIIVYIKVMIILVHEIAFSYIFSVMNEWINSFVGFLVSSGVKPFASYISLHKW